MRAIPNETRNKAIRIDHLGLISNSQWNLRRVHLSKAIHRRYQALLSFLHKFTFEISRGDVFFLLPDTTKKNQQS